MTRTVDTVITPETYLDALGLDVPTGTLVEPHHRAALYELVVEFLDDHGGVSHVDAQKGVGLEMRVPGSAVHVRVGLPTVDELKVFAMLAAVILGADVDPQALTAAGLVSLRQRLAKTDARFGERSVVDAVLELKRATAADITLALYGKPCRHPAAKCRYLRGDTCGIGLQAAEALAEDLSARQILRRLTAASPAEYRVAL